MNPPHRIALFGGSFDPVHRGHLTIAQRALESMSLDEVRFIPCRLSPHKTDRQPASGEDRLEMLRLATAKLPWAGIEEFELHSPPPSYSYLTVQKLQRDLPNARWFWLLGEDQWRSLPTWKNAEQLRDSLEFIVFTRSDTSPEPRAGWTMHQIEGQHPASSTAVREQISINSPPADWLPDGVLDYIEEHELYLKDS